MSVYWKIAGTYCPNCKQRIYSQFSPMFDDNRPKCLRCKLPAKFIFVVVKEEHDKPKRKTLDRDISRQ